MKNNFGALFLIILLFTSCKTKEEDPMPKHIQSYSYLALGDSYTIGESVEVSGTYPALLTNALQENQINISGTKIIARTGWTTQDLQDAISVSLQEDAKFDMVSLLIGVNNQYQGKSLSEYKIEFNELLTKAILLAGGNKNRVFVISIPDYGYTPFGVSNQKEISDQIDSFNLANKEITNSLGILYFDITPISRQGLTNPSLVAADGLHPSSAMYQLWVDLMFSKIKAMLVD